MAAGDAVVAPSTTKRLLTHFAGLLPKVSSTPDTRLDVLTEREREVLTLVGRGLNNAELAATLFLGEATVKTHLLRAFAKLGVDDRTRAVTAAMEQGILPPPTRQ